MWRNWRKQFNFAMYDPENFDERFGITTSKIRIVSVILLVLLLLSVFFTFIFIKSPLGNYFSSSPVDSHEIINQQIRIDSLSKKIQNQENYIHNLSNILLGNIDTDTINDDKPNLQIDPNTINPNISRAEKKIAENVKSDQYTNTQKEINDFVHFIVPVKGTVDKTNNLSVNIITQEDDYFSACLSGTVIFSGYTQKDGNFLIIEHPNNFTSIYKHAKKILKNSGEKVRTGDVIGIVGNFGSQITKPHLYFELWLNQQLVDPKKYINFNS